MLAVDLLVRVGLATVLGVVIGFERQWRSRIAGLQPMSWMCRATGRSRPEVKDLAARVMPAPQFQLRSVRARPAHAADHVDLQAGYASAARDDLVAEEEVRTLSQRPGVTLARWSIFDEQAADWSR